MRSLLVFFFFQAEDGIRDRDVTGVQTCALPISEFIEHQPALETSFDGALVDAMADALRELDPAARPVPYMLSGGTDAKAFARLGIRCFGFAPLKLPAGLDFSALFHGIDERVPVDGLKFGVGVLDRFLSR